MAMVRVCLALAVLLTSCWSPVFNESVSLAALSAAKMRHDLNQTQSIYSVPQDAVFRLYASRQINPPFLVVTATDLEGSRAQVWTKSGTEYLPVSQNGVSFTNPVSDPDLVSLVMGVNTDTTQWYIAHYPTLWTGRLQGFSSADQVFQVAAWDLPGNLSQSGLSYGGIANSYYPLQPGSVFLMQFDSLTGNVGIGSEADFDPLGTANENFPLGGTFQLALPQHYGWLAINPFTLDVLFTVGEKDSKGLYTTYQVTPVVGNLVIQDHFTRADHIVAWLSTGEFLSREGGYYHVVDSSFQVKYSFPAGNLVFMDEVDDTSGTIVRFSSVVQASDGNGGESNDYILDIYSIPTSKLKTLQ